MTKEGHYDYYSAVLAMPCGERIGGGFILTVKSTKKYVYLPEGHPIYTVVLFDNTGEMLADFKGAKEHILH